MDVNNDKDQFGVVWKIGFSPILDYLKNRTFTSDPFPKQILLSLEQRADIYSKVFQLVEQQFMTKEAVNPHKVFYQLYTKALNEYFDECKQKYLHDCSDADYYKVVTTEWANVYFLYDNIKIYYSVTNKFYIEIEKIPGLLQLTSSKYQEYVLKPYLTKFSRSINIYINQWRETGHCPTNQMSIEEAFLSIQYSANFDDCIHPNSELIRSSICMYTKKYYENTIQFQPDSQYKENIHRIEKIFHLEDEICSVMKIVGIKDTIETILVDTIVAPTIPSLYPVLISELYSKGLNPEMELYLEYSLKSHMHKEVIIDILKKLLNNKYKTIVDLYTNSMRQVSSTDIYKERKIGLLYIEDIIVSQDTLTNLKNSPIGSTPEYAECVTDYYTSLLNHNICSHYDNYVLVNLLLDRYVHQSNQQLSVGPSAVKDPAQMINSLLSLSSYLIDKKLFISYYLQIFVCRMLNNARANISQEKRILKSLKDYFSRLLLSDFDDIIDKYESNQTSKFYLSLMKYMNKNSITNKMILNIYLLARDTWTYIETQDVSIEDIPAGMRYFTNTFNQWAETEKSLCKLSYSRGYVVINLNYSKKHFTIQMLPLQAIIINTFISSNSIKQLSISDLKKQFGLDDHHVYTILSPLIHSKYNLLIKSPDSSLFKDSDIVSWNFSFSSSSTTSFIVPQCYFAPSSQVVNPHGDERALDVNTVVKLKIVQYMKEMKQSTVDDIRKNIESHLQSNHIECVTVNDVIKKEIDILIEKEFIERDAKNNSILNYVE